MRNFGGVEGTEAWLEWSEKRMPGGEWESPGTNIQQT